MRELSQALGISRGNDRDDGGDAGSDAARMDDDCVRVYDFETKAVSVIPAAELAPGMVQVRMKDLEGEVWIDASRLKPHSYQYPPFTEEVRDYIRQIKAALDEVYPMSLEAWEDGFRRDSTPEREIAHWRRVAAVYARLTSAEGSSEAALLRKHDIFRVLIGCGIAPREQVLTVVDRGSLSREDAEGVVAAFFKRMS